VIAAPNLLIFDPTKRDLCSAMRAEIRKCAQFTPEASQDDVNIAKANRDRIICYLVAVGDGEPIVPKRLIQLNFAVSI
jgi:hypothetical protein